MIWSPFPEDGDPMLCVCSDLREIEMMSCPKDVILSAGVVELDPF